MERPRPFRLSGPAAPGRQQRPAACGQRLPAPQLSAFSALFHGLDLSKQPCPPLEANSRPLGRGARGAVEALAQPRPVSKEEEEGKGRGRGKGNGVVDVAALPSPGWIPSRGRGDTPPGPIGRASTIMSLRGKPCPARVPTSPGPRPSLQPTATPGTPWPASRPASWTRAAAKGATLPVGLNSVKISFQNKAVYQYHVTFSPEVECRSTRFAMLKEHQAVTGNLTAFDGSILFLPILLPQQVSLKAHRRSDGEEITITIQKTKVLEPSSDLCIPFYNVLFRRVLSLLGMKLIGRNFFEPDKATVLQQFRLQIWAGYSVSIQKKDSGLFLSVDTIHKVVRNESILSFMNSLYRQKASSFQEECIKQLVGSVVITRYNNRTYRVDDIDWSKTPRDTWILASGEEITFLDYYRKNYDIAIKDLDQPLLVHRPKRKQMPQGKRQLDTVLLVPELTFLTGLPDTRRDSRIVKEVTRELQQSPGQHYARLISLLRRIRESPEASHLLQHWGLRLDPGIHMAQGRVLPPERINLRRSSFVPAKDLSWNREISQEAPISTIAMNYWLLVYPKHLQDMARELVAVVESVCGPIGMQVQRPVLVELKDDYIETYAKGIRSVLGTEDKVQLLVCLVSSSREDLYSAIKKLCCVHSPVPSQVISARTLLGPASKMKVVVQKVMLQVNCKLGGELWSVEIPLKELMVIGMDIYHCLRKGTRSVVGFVASMNPILTKWYSKVVFQMPHQEIADSLRLCLADALQHFHKMNHCLPKRIVVYRDGVSDSQLDMVLKYEIPQMQKCFDSFENYQPSMVVVVVQKQISTNFYTLAGEQVACPPPGTVIDHTITSTDWQDFFLLAHHSHQGRSNPTRYICLLNTANLSSEHLQRLTFKLCHLYWNWPGTIRVPAPCKYAHKLAFLSGHILHQEPSAQLCDKLFFL